MCYIEASVIIYYIVDSGTLASDRLCNVEDSGILASVNYVLNCGQ